MTLNDIQHALREARAEYQQKRDELPVPKLQALHVKIKELMTMQSQFIRRGAFQCPDCGELPHGMIQPAASAALGVFDTFEIGCLRCGDYMVQRDGEAPVRVSHRARSATREGAVSAWNAGPSEWMKKSV